MYLRQWHPIPVLLPGNSHGQRSLVGCSPWGRWELDKTQWLHFHFSLSCIGEGSVNPLQCSCLENPWDGGAWWAAVYGITQSRTRLKWLSSSTARKILAPQPGIKPMPSTVEAPDLQGIPCGDQFSIHTNLKSLCYLPGTNMVSVNYISIKNNFWRKQEKISCDLVLGKNFLGQKKQEVQWKIYGLNLIKI